MAENPQQPPKTAPLEEDDFFGESDNGEDGQNGGPDMAERDHKSRQKEFWTIGYQEAFGETKETKLQEGFEAGFRQMFDVSRAIGRNLGRLVAMEVLNRETSTVFEGETDPSQGKIVQEAVRSISEYARLHEEESQKQKDAAQTSHVEKEEEEDLKHPSTTLLMTHLTELTRQVEKDTTRITFDSV